jgi:hypothetical protein
MGFGIHELSFLSNTVNEIAFANEIPSKNAVKKFLADVEEQYDKKLGFESKIDKLKTEVNKLGQQELKFLGVIIAIPKLGMGVVKLLYLHHDDSKSTSIEELQLLIDQVQKCGGINAAINKLSQSEQHEKERHDVETRDEALVSVDYQTNKNSSSSSNEKMKKEEEERLISAVGQNNNHDELTDRFFVNKIIAKRSSSSATKIDFIPYSSFNLI